MMHLPAELRESYENPYISVLERALSRIYEWNRPRTFTFAIYRGVGRQAHVTAFEIQRPTLSPKAWSGRGSKFANAQKKKKKKNERPREVIKFVVRWAYVSILTILRPASNAQLFTRKVFQDSEKDEILTRGNADLKKLIVQGWPKLTRMWWVCMLFSVTSFFPRKTLIFFFSHA